MLQITGSTKLENIKPIGTPSCCRNSGSQETRRRDLGYNHHCEGCFGMFGGGFFRVLISGNIFESQNRLAFVIEKTRCSGSQAQFICIWMM